MTYKETYNINDPFDLNHNSGRLSEQILDDEDPIPTTEEADALFSVVEKYAGMNGVDVGDAHFHLYKTGSIQVYDLPDKMKPFVSFHPSAGYAEVFYAFMPVSEKHRGLVESLDLLHGDFGRIVNEDNKLSKLVRPLYLLGMTDKDDNLLTVDLYTRPYPDHVLEIAYNTREFVGYLVVDVEKLNNHLQKMSDAGLDPGLAFKDTLPDWFGEEGEELHERLLSMASDRIFNALEVTLNHEDCGLDIYPGVKDPSTGEEAAIRYLASEKRFFHSGLALLGSSISELAEQASADCEKSLLKHKLINKTPPSKNTGPRL